MINLVVELPDEFKALLGMALTVIVTQILKFVGDKIGYDISGYTAQVVAGLVAAALVVANGALSNIPVEFKPLADQLIGLVLIILSSFSAYKYGLSPFLKKG